MNQQKQGSRHFTLVVVMRAEHAILFAKAVFFYLMVSATLATTTNCPSPPPSSKPTPDRQCWRHATTTP
jgi:hypothetical protein